MRLLPVLALTLAPLFLTACDETAGGATTAAGKPIAELPEGVLAIVAHNQDLSSVKLDETGCYVYRYVGPVETTYLPLRARNGRPICARPQETPPATAS